MPQEISITNGLPQIQSLGKYRQLNYYNQKTEHIQMHTNGT